MGKSYSPGVLHRVIDGTTYRRASGDVKFGIVGVADWGPINTPTLVSSPGDLNAKFGGLYQGIYMAQNILQFSPYVYYNRVVKVADAAKALTNIVCDSTNIILVTAKYEGTKGNDLSVLVKAATDGTANKIDIQVKLNGVIVETFRNVSSTTYTTLTSDWVVFAASSGSPVWPSDWADAYNDEFDLAGGDSGEDATNAEVIGAKGVTGVSTDTGLYAFARKNWRMLDVVCAPGYSDDTIITAVKTLVNVYHSKQVMAMIDAPDGLNRTTLMALVNGESTWSQIVNDYALTIAYPWHNMKNSAGEEYAVSPSAIMGAVWASAIKQAIYKAPAGPKRGLWPYSSSLRLEFEEDDIAIMYSQDGQCINVFYNDPERGIVLTGQKTTYRTNSDLNRVKTVFNLNRMIKELDYLVSGETFEDNNANLWSVLGTYAEQVMGGRKAAGLLWDYEFVCNADLNTVDGRITDTAHAQVRVQFTPTAEWIEIDWVLSPAGSDFTII